LEYVIDFVVTLAFVFRPLRVPFYILSFVAISTGLLLWLFGIGTDFFAEEWPWAWIFGGSGGALLLVTWLGAMADEEYDGIMEFVETSVNGGKPSTDDAKTHFGKGVS